MATTISGDNGIDKVANGTVDLTTDVTGSLPSANGGLPAAGTSGNVLTSNGTAWTSIAPSGGVTSLNGQTGAITNTSLYAIGSYVTGRPQNHNTVYAVDTTLAGSSLYSVSTPITRNAGAWVNSGSAVTGGTALVNTGTWRCVSPCGTDSGNAVGLPGLWVRIS